MSQALDNRGDSQAPARNGFGQRLRGERERRRITLRSIAANTKINIALLESLERNDVSRWPSGIFRRSFVRAYAEAVGLDPDETVQEFRECFPDASHDLPFAAASEDASGGGERGVGPALRVTLAYPGTAFTRGILLPEIRRRGAAVLWDAGVVIAIGVVFFLVLGRFWQPLGITVLCYYIGSIFLLGNTAGVCLFAPEPTPSADADNPSFPKRAVRHSTRAVSNLERLALRNWVRQPSNRTGS
jgi:transcriptional regulator with XRE-family HTH domain